MMGLFEEEHLSWVEKIILLYKICYVYNVPKPKTHKRKTMFSENFKIVCVTRENVNC
jgi:predicted ATP-grasp superfamily ATP-dependent carboligase